MLYSLVLLFSISVLFPLFRWLQIIKIVHSRSLWNIQFIIIVNTNKSYSPQGTEIAYSAHFSWIACVIREQLMIIWLVKAIIVWLIIY